MTVLWRRHDSAFEPGLTISAKFRRNFGNFFVSASYRDPKFRYFSIYFVSKFKIQQISSKIHRNLPKFRFRYTPGFHRKTKWLTLFWTTVLVSPSRNPRCPFFSWVHIYRNPGSPFIAAQVAAEQRSFSTFIQTFALAGGCQNSQQYSTISQSTSQKHSYRPTAGLQQPLEPEPHNVPVQLQPSRINSCQIIVKYKGEPQIKCDRRQRNCSNFYR